MPDDVPLEKQSHPMRQHAWNRSFRHWEWFFALATAAVTAMVWVEAETTGKALVASLWMASLVLWYLALGRHLITAESRGWPAHVYRVGVLVLFVPLAVAEPVSMLMLFPLISHLFWIPPLRATIPAVVALNFVPALTNAVDGAPLSDVLWALPICATTAGASVILGVFIHRIIDQSVDRFFLIEELEASRAEVERLSHEAGVAAERQRLGAELHDTVTQGLSSIIMLAQASRTASDEGRREEQLDLIEQTARANLAEARAMVESLSPGDTAAIHVETALAELSEAADAPFTMEGEPRRLPPAAAVVLVRAVQEALRNVEKHAAGAGARVRLAYRDSVVAVSVTDDGPGFDPDAPAAGFGLRGTRNRVIGLGGTFEVDSAPGDGAAMRLELPA